MLLAWLRFALVVCLGCARLAHSISLPADTQLIEKATLTVTLAGQTHTREVDLPYHWDTHHPGQSGQGVFHLRWTMPQGPQVPWGLYLQRLGNAYEVSLNQVVLQRKGQLSAPDGSDYAKVPRYLSLAPGLVGAENVLRIHIHAETGRRGGLAPVLVGPVHSVEPFYRQAHLWRVTGSIVVLVFSFLVGMLSLALWATQTTNALPARGHRRDPVFLYAGLAELFWTLRVADSLIDTPPLPWPWWELIPVMSIGAWACCMALFCMEVAAWRTGPRVRAFKVWLALSMLASPVAALLAVSWGLPMALTLWYGVLLLTFLGFGGVYLWQGAKVGVAWPHRLLAVTILINTAVGARDLYVIRIHPTYGVDTLMRYWALLFGMALALIVIVRFRAALMQARDLMHTLQARIAEKETELKASYQASQLILSESVRASERASILRDMHDGVGSLMSSAILQIQQGRLEKDVLLSTMREALDQLKLSVDVLSIPEGDVNTLLASLRYRLEPRLKLSGIKLVWDVDALPLLEQLKSQHLRQLQFVLYEALSNVLQHAHAQTIRLQARASEHCISLAVCDDGCGFVPGESSGKGLFSMRERLAFLGAQLDIASTPGRGTVVRISMPLK